ncbi:MAG: hypothetical protein ACOYON_01210 [Fimbriimonas sp.]
MNERMNVQSKPNITFRERGQTVIIALIVLGVLMIVGTVFIGLINRNIQTQARLQGRSEANDLAEAGIRYAHDQLVKSELGADWRGTLTPPVANAAGLSNDPDAYYLRLATGFPLRSDVDPQIDLGGPDGLGPFVRVNFANGRALIRVRYAPSDANIFSSSPTGALRSPGLARNYLVIESVGREGTVNLNDPTTIGRNSEVQVSNYLSAAAFRQAAETMRANENQFVTSRRLVAFASIGIIESARFITDVHRTSHPAEIGSPRELGAVYQGLPVLPVVQVGTATSLYSFGANPTPTADLIEGMGSIHSNAPLVINGLVSVNLNATLGDKITVADSVIGADDSSTLRVNRRSVDRLTGNWLPVATTNLTNPLGLNSRSPLFSTLGGVLVDGLNRTDAAGYSTGVGYKTPPLAFQPDIETGVSRYELLTRESGVQTPDGNQGRFGHGQGVYVDNVGDRQIGEDEAARAKIGTQESLVYDWLNPNNGQSNSAWQGPFYVPRGSYVYLHRDGFTIIRDARSSGTERTWKRPDGSETGAAAARFRIGLNSAGQVAIVNSFTPSVNIGGNLSAADFDRGQPFNGILYFEGNVRVRGTIPTDVQLTLVSRASIYIEGSITKGVTDASGTRLTRPSRSMLALIAREYVAVNTPMFFGPTANTVLEEVQDSPTTTGFNPVRMRVPSGQMAFQTEFVLDPNTPGGNANNPSTLRPFVSDYAPANAPANRLDTLLMLSHTMDDGPAPTSTFSMNINYGLADAPGSIVSSYQFARSASNAANNLFAGTGNIPVYGLGIDPWQRFGKFESTGFPLVRPTQLNLTTSLITSTGPEGNYRFPIGEPNELLFRPNLIGGAAANDYLLSRIALVPHDIRIEATIYAQEGSFFVIPGAWFNPNPNDSRANYVNLGATDDERRANRLENYGSSAEMPFYGEPIDVRVNVVGAISENLPPPISQQAEWIKKWGWIPRELGATGSYIPTSHFPVGANAATTTYVPNLIVSYDPVLATARIGGFVNTNDSATLLRVDEFGRALPPLPRLPVSSALTYFGEVN